MGFTRSTAFHGARRHTIGVIKVVAADRFGQWQGHDCPPEQHGRAVDDLPAIRCDCDHAPSDVPRSSSRTFSCLAVLSARSTGSACWAWPSGTASASVRAEPFGAVLSVANIDHASPMVTLSVCPHVMPGSQQEAADLFARLVREAGA